MKEITPCEYIDLPQRYLEPILGRYASHHNFKTRFSTDVVSIETTGEYPGTQGFIYTLRDHITEQTFPVRSNYLFGADGAKGVVPRSLHFEYVTNPVGVRACNVLIRADLTKYAIEERQASLNWIFKPDNSVFPGIFGLLRLVRPWTEWVVVAFGPGGSNPFEGMEKDDLRIVACVREMVGDDSLNVEVLALDPWSARDSVATEYSKRGSNAFILGDAVHRHPPTYGLGGNTCIQDAYNLAWKIAYVSKGLAGRGLLDTFTVERQPIGQMLAKESNMQLRANNDVWEALGMLATSPEEGLKQVSELAVGSAAGSARRAKLHRALETKRQEVESLGLAHNHWYSSSAICTEDEISPKPTLSGDPIVEVQVLSYPGSRLPHAWIDVPSRGRMRSTLDLAGKGSFCLITGVGGEAWRAAAHEIREKTGIPVNCFGIGAGLDYIDVHRDWHTLRGVEDDGCVLVRPDRFVAWRSISLVRNCNRRLMQVLDGILSRGELGQGS